MNTKIQGDVGLGVAIGYFAKNLQTVSIPLTDSQEYDLVVDFKGELKKIQVKTTRSKEKNKYVVQLKTSGGNRSGKHKIKNFDGSSVDFIFIFCFSGDSYLIPTDENFPVSKLVLGDKYNQYKLAR